VGVEEANIAVVRKAYEAFGERDWESWLALADPEVEFLPAGTAALKRGGRAYHGHTGLREYFEDVEEVWEELRVVPQSFRAVGDHVLVRGRIYARTADGLLVDSAGHWIWRIVGGKVVWGCAYADEDEALEALGIDRG
jgi:ketosteroid isomerase-like protein